MDLISGRNVVKEAMRAGVHIRKIYLADSKLQGQIGEIIGQAQDKGIEIEKVARQDLDEMVPDLHQGLVAEISPYKTYGLHELLEAGARKFVILDGIEDPHNLGAIIRTAEAGGFDSVIIQDRRSAGITNTVHRTSAGASFHMKIGKVTNLTRAINTMKDYDIWIYGADGQADNLYSQVDLTGGIGLVIGSEGKGISRLVKENCDMVVRIPMLGRVESLNASTAAAVLIYEVVRQNG